MQLGSFFNITRWKQHAGRPSLGQGMHDIVRTTAKMMGSLGGGRKIGIRHGDCFASHRMAGALEAC
jgi:hypothetical protein